MSNDDLFELMTKMYAEMQQGFGNIDKRFEGIDKRFEGTDKNFEGINNRLTKLQIGQEELKTKLDTITEVQRNHMQEDENAHVQIVEMLNDRIDTTRKAVRKISEAR